MTDMQIRTESSGGVVSLPKSPYAMPQNSLWTEHNELRPGGPEPLGITTEAPPGDNGLRSRGIQWLSELRSRQDVDI